VKSDKPVFNWALDIGTLYYPFPIGRVFFIPLHARKWKRDAADCQVLIRTSRIDRFSRLSYFLPGGNELPFGRFTVRFVYSRQIDIADPQQDPWGEMPD
jgi:hypothetical protein